jgi:hypothetical protein
MDPVTSGELQCRIGDEVVDSSDHKIGKVIAFDTRILTVEHGLLRKDNYYIPVSAVNACNDGKAYLNVRKDDVEAQGWSIPPAIPTEADGVPLLPTSQEREAP